MRLKEKTKIELRRDINEIGLNVVYCRIFAGSHVAENDFLAQRPMKTRHVLARTALKNKIVEFEHSELFFSHGKLYSFQNERFHQGSTNSRL